MKASADNFETEFKAAGHGAPSDSIATLVAETISAALDHLLDEVNALKPYGG
jgi:hypothetical protein